MMENWRDLKPHPAATVMPAMTAAEYARMKGKIAVRYAPEHPIVLFEGQILDGIHRHRICVELDVEPPMVEYAGDPLDVGSWVLQENLDRRQLTEDQQHMVVLNMAPYIRGAVADRARAAMAAAATRRHRRERMSASAPVSQPRGAVDLPEGRATRKPRERTASAIMAAKINGSISKMERAKRLKVHAPDYAARVESGDMGLSEALRKSGLEREGAKRKPAPAPRKPLNVRTAELAEMEGMMESKMEAFREVAACLYQIRERMLFMDQYGNYPRYLKERWNVGKQEFWPVTNAVDLPIIAQINKESHR